MNKALKFAPNLVDLVLTGKLTSTWRLWDDKDFKVGEIVDFLEFGSLKKFAIAMVDKVEEKKMNELTLDEMKDHYYSSGREDMYKKFSEFYKRPVDGETIVKIIWFSLR